MQQGSSQVSSGNITPTVGPQRDTKEVIVLAGVVLFLGGLLAAAWLYSQSGDQDNGPPVMERIDHANVPDSFKRTTVMNYAEASTTHPAQITTPVALIPDITHADIYFEVGRKGLTDEAKAQLATQADILTQHKDYGVLIQGYTDQQGSVSYNKQLGLRRAETVKAELISAGIAEHRIKTVSLGEEGVLCVDTSDICRRMNRRVHLEIRKIGQEHMVLPPVPTTTSETSDSSIDSLSTMGDSDSTTESIPPSPSVPTSTLEPAGGS
ncbi:MAG: OmpA family protein [Nitrospira sp.]|nr:OmpA family protein [Nitrospira sp.]